jgi:hypothetical protein
MSHVSPDTVARTPAQRSFIPLLAQSFVVQWPFYIVAAAYALTTYLLLADIPSYTQAPIKNLATGIITLTIPAGLAAVFLFRLLQYVLVIKPESPVRQMKEDVAGLFRRPAPFVVALPLLIAMIVFNKGMLELKPMIPLVTPFSYDAALIAWDRALHFGFDPWALLQPVMGYDLVTFAFNMAYNFWFLALFGTFMWFGFARQASVVRTQFFLAYMLCWWIGGGFLAVHFSSAGPVYYGLLGHTPDPFLPLMSYLKDVDSRIPIWALDAQQVLWDGYLGKVTPIGISAFPSMHNASAVLFALAATRVNRRAGICFWVYAVVILVGSVHLGWHYAVDGYAAIALALACWWIAGFAARWHGQLPSTARFNESLALL